MKKITPMKAIRKKCLDCCCGSSREVALCTVEDCSLYAYRSGHRPPKNDFNNLDEENIIKG